MQMHFESKHPKEDEILFICFNFHSHFLQIQDFSLEKCTDQHAVAGGVTTQGIGVRGGIKKHHN